MEILITGTKEYPMGTNKGDDLQPSGGIEIYVDNFVRELGKHKGIEIKVITMRFKKQKDMRRMEISRYIA